jgi:hypothetical protein
VQAWGASYARGVGTGSAERRLVRPSCSGVWLSAWIALAIGCSPHDESVTGSFSGTAGSFGGIPSGGSGPSCGLSDSDSDGIDDAVEGAWDQDGDGLVNSKDLDSDNDGISDREEALNTGACSLLRDCDNDSVSDMFDLDSDDDALPDAQEKIAGTSQCMGDTDGDGCDDFPQFQLGACNMTNVFEKACRDSLETSVVFAAIESAERLDVHLEVAKLANGFDLDWIDGATPMGVVPTDGATMDATGFSDVKAGALLRVDVKFAALPSSTALPWTLLLVRARTPEGKVLGEGRLLLLVDKCARPLPI